MASARHYTPLSNPRASSDAEREMHEAFDDDDNDDHGETEPLTLHQQRSPRSAGPPSLRSIVASAAPQSYDFERDYDYPPPGSPPPSHSHSTFAFPNNYGNSNGHLPTSPVLRKPPQSILRRAFGAFFPQSYQRVRGDDARPRGGGTDNDGVFANVTAKPAPPVTLRTEDGEVYIVPEETQQEAPPSYIAASADAAPSYWDTVVHAPSGIDINGDMIIDELPTGSVLVFVITTIISWFFQLPGFILTYLLHCTHAGRFGAQAGLALTLIQWGFGTTVMGSFPSSDDPPSPDGSGLDPGELGVGNPPPPPSPSPGGMTDGGMMGNSSGMARNGSTLADMQMSYTGREWVSFLLMTVGWFLLLTSIIGYFRVKRFELSVRASRAAPPVLTPENIQRDVALRQNLEEVFGISVLFDSAVAAATTNSSTEQTADMAQQGGIVQAIYEARLQNDLRNAGLI